MSRIEKKKAERNTSILSITDVMLPFIMPVIPPCWPSKMGTTSSYTAVEDAAQAFSYFVTKFELSEGSELHLNASPTIFFFIVIIIPSARCASSATRAEQEQWQWRWALSGVRVGYHQVWIFYQAWVLLLRMKPCPDWTTWQTFLHFQVTKDCNAVCGSALF